MSRRWVRRFGNWWFAGGVNPLQINGHRVSAGKGRRKVGNTPTAPDRITAERVARSIRTRFDPLPTLNPRSLAQSLQQFECGYLESAARTFDAMERRDDRLASVAGKAKSALARYGFEVLIADGDLHETEKTEALRHKAALEYLYTHCTATNAVREDETGGFSLLVRQMADAIGKRYSVHEIVWEPGDDGTLTATFRHAPLWFFEAITGRLRFKGQDGVSEGMPMDPDAWLVTVGDGIMEACAVLWMFKHLPLRDWLAYSEKFGMPYLLGKTGAAFNSAEWNAMATALRGFGSDGAAVIGGADDIVPVQAGGSSQDLPFQGLVERSDRAMSILWRGADLGTQSHGTSGGGQGASLQGDETAALDEDRAAWLTESLSAVSRTAIRYLFGPATRPLAYVRIKTLVRRNIQLDLAVDAFLLNNGAPVGRADALERYGRRTPRADEPLLQPPLTPSGPARSVASEDASLASIERAANDRPLIPAANEAEATANIVQLVGAANDVAAIAPTVGESIGHADRWFQVSPFGRFPHRVGMQVFDRQAANAIVDLFNSARDRLARLWRGLPIFIGHPDLDPKTYPDHRKYGSIQRLEVRDDGLYAQARWSRAGREIVNDEHFDFPSPLWNMEPVPREAGAFRPVELISVGLTNRPNIANKPVGANTQTPHPAEELDSMKREDLITQLGLRPAEGAATVTDEQIAATVARLLSAENENTRLSTQLRAANEAREQAERERGEQSILAANERRARIEDRLVVAANAGRITEAGKAGWRTRLEGDFDAGCTALDGLAPAMNTRATQKTSHLGERNGGTVAMTRATRIQAANEAVEARLRETNDGDYGRAFAWARGQKPELFKDMQEPEA